MDKKITSDYLDDILVRLAYHSSAIEGNTITLNETISILLNNTIPEMTNKREFFEIENHKQAFEYMVENLNNNEELSISIILGIHFELMDHLDFNRGKFKTSTNAIVGADFETTPPEKTPTMMYQWVNNLNYQLKMATSNIEKIKIILEKHIEFERIHPFSDGNGRTGRMLINYLLLLNEIPPIIITKELKDEYMIGLRDQNVDKLVEFSKKLIEKEKNKMEAFR